MEFLYLNTIVIPDEEDKSLSSSLWNFFNFQIINLPEIKLNCRGCKMAGHNNLRKMKPLTTRVLTSRSWGHFPITVRCKQPHMYRTVLEDVWRETIMLYLTHHCYLLHVQYRIFSNIPCTQKTLTKNWGARLIRAKTLMTSLSFITCLLS